MTVHQYDKWLCKTVHDLCLFLQTGNLPSSSCVSIRILDKESGLVKRKWFTNIVRIFCTYFAFTSFDSERI
jgi:hypothetical protein